MTTRLTTRLATRLATRPAVGYTQIGGGDPLPPTPPVFTEHPQSVSVDEGDPLILSALAMGRPAPTYQWQHSEDNIAWSDRVGLTNRNLVIPEARVSDGGYWRCKANNSAGTEYSNATLVDVSLPVYDTVRWGNDIAMLWSDNTLVEW